MNSDLEDAIKWLIAGVVIVAVAWAPVSCSKNKSEKIQSAIESGIDPIKAKCAYTDAGGPVCSIAAMNIGDKK